MASGERKGKKDAEPKVNGRPSIYTPELIDRICQQIADGKSVRTICAQDDMPGMSTIFEWLAKDSGFAEQYARARDMQADKYAEEIIQIADDGINDTYLDEDGNARTDHDVIARSRLRVDARKWYASKLAPKKYGDRVMQEVTGKDGGAIEVDMTIKPEEAYLKMIGKV